MIKDEALKMAIEQMKHLIKIYIPSPEWSGTAIQKDCYETIQACKKALEQKKIGDAEIKRMLNDIEWYQMRVKVLEEELEASQTIEEQEPYAYAYVREDGAGQLCWTSKDKHIFKDYFLEGWKEIPLYTKEKNHG